MSNLRDYVVHKFRGEPFIVPASENYSTTAVGISMDVRYYRHISIELVADATCDLDWYVQGALDQNMEVQNVRDFSKWLTSAGEDNPWFRVPFYDGSTNNFVSGATLNTTNTPGVQTLFINTDNLSFINFRVVAVRGGSIRARAFACANI